MTTKKKNSLYLIAQPDKEVLGFVQAHSSAYAKEIAGRSLGIVDYEKLIAFSTYFPDNAFIHFRWLMSDTHITKE